MTDRTIRLVIVGNESDGVRAFRNQGQAADQLHNKVSKLGKGLKALALAGAAGIAAIGVGRLLKDSVAGWQDHLRVVRQTAAVFKSTGGAAHASVKHVFELSNALERKTTIDNDVVQSGANMLLTFTNVRNEVGKGNAIFDRATATVLDMSTALGQDTKTSAIQLGKALNDPIKGVSALQRVGVTFTAQQKKQIKTLVESGHQLEAQKIILGELNKEFGGSAEAAVTPLGRLQVLFRGMKDAIGSALLPALNTLTRGLLTKFGPAIQRIGDHDGPRLANTLNRWAHSLVAVIPPADQLALSWDKLSNKAKALAYDLTRGGAAFKAAFGGHAQGNADADGFVTGLEKLGTKARELVESFKRARAETNGFRDATDGLRNTATVGGAAMGVLANNLDKLQRFLPALAAGFLAYKAAQALANVASVAHVALLPAQIAGNFALARSNKALAASYGQIGVAAEGAAVGQGAAAGATAAGGAAAAGSSSRWSGLAGTLGLATVALTLAANANGLLNKAQSFGHQIHVQWVAPMYEKLGIYSHARVVQLQQEAAGSRGAGGATRGLTTAEILAADAAERHTGAVRGERTAIDLLKGALQGERTAELDVRQAKLNVSNAQIRLTGLVKDGRRGSNDYKQAQIDLKRAQIDLKERTTDYKTAQLKANSATAGAMHASQSATGPVRTLGDAAHTGGTKAGDARIPWRKLGETVATAYTHIHNKTAKITANFGWNGLKVFNVGGGLQALAGGGLIDQGTGPTADDVLVRVSKGETVVPAHASAEPGFKAWAAAKRIPGFKAGGVIPHFGMPGSGGFGAALGEWGVQAGKVLALAEARFKKLASRFGGRPGILNFIRSVDRLPYVWGAAGPGGYDCSGLASAVYGLHTGRGGGHGQRYFTTSSNFGGVAGLKPGLGGVLNLGVNNYPGHHHMAGSYGGLGFEAESTRTGIKIGRAASPPSSFARTYHMAKGGRIDQALVKAFTRLGLDFGGDPSELRIDGKAAPSFAGGGVVHAGRYDRGGLLMPGLTLARNATGLPEQVLAPHQLPSRGGEVHFHFPHLVVLGGDARKVAAELQPHIRKAIRDAQRREGHPITV